MLEQENYEAVITELTTLGFTSIFKDDYQNIMSKEKIDYNIQDGMLVSVEKNDNKSGYGINYYTRNYGSDYNCSFEDVKKHLEAISNDKIPRMIISCGVVPRVIISYHDKLMVTSLLEKKYFKDDYGMLMKKQYEEEKARLEDEITKFYLRNPNATNVPHPVDDTSFKESDYYLYMHEYNEDYNDELAKICALKASKLPFKYRICCNPLQEYGTIKLKTHKKD